MKIKISKELYNQLEKESSARNLDIESYINTLIFKMDLINKIANSMIPIGNSLESFFLEHKENFIFFMDKVKGIGDDTILDYIYALNSSLKDIYYPDNLKYNLGINKSNKYIKGLRLLFSYMKFINMNKFNNFSIAEWKDVIPSVRDINIDSKKVFNI